MLFPERAKTASNEAKTAMAKAKSELFFCVDLDSQKHCVTITNSELPHG